MSFLLNFLDSMADNVRRRGAQMNTSPEDIDGDDDGVNINFHYTSVAIGIGFVGLAAFSSFHGLIYLLGL